MNFGRSFEVFSYYLLLAVLDIYHKKQFLPYRLGFKGRKHRWKDTPTSFSIDLEGMGWYNPGEMSQKCLWQWVHFLLCSPSWAARGKITLCVIPDRLYYCANLWYIHNLEM